MACCCCSPLTRRLHLLHSPWFSESRWPLHLQASLSLGENSTDLEYWGAGETRPRAERRKKWDLMACFRISWVLIQCRQVQMLFEFSLLGSSSGVLSSDTDSDPKFVQAFIWPNGNISPWTFRKSQFLLCTTMHPFYNNLFWLHLRCRPSLLQVLLWRHCSPFREICIAIRLSDIPWRQRASASTVFPASLPCYHTLCKMHVSKIPSEMEVAPRYNCLHCWHWWHYLHYLHYKHCLHCWHGLSCWHGFHCWHGKHC